MGIAARGQAEYVDGHVYSFAGGTIEHNALSMALSVQIAPAARPCHTYGSDMLIEMATSSRYADVVVTCDERDRTPGARVIRFPKLIVEVLSDSTARIDLEQKRLEYQAIATLEEFFAVDSRRPWVQRWTRNPDGWTPDEPISAGTLQLSSLAVTIDVQALYAGAL